MCEGENDGKSEYCSVREADPLMRRGLALAALVVPSLLGAGIAAPAALAADDCPNAAVRAQQQSQHLPNCMAYEKVTPANKGGEAPGVIQITEDGDGLTFMLNAAIEDAQSFVNGRYRALRSADGRWTTNGLMPAMDGPVLPALNAGISDPHAVTPDLSRMVLDTTYAVNPNDQGITLPALFKGTVDQYLREADGSFRWLVPDASVPDTSTFDVTFAAASSDLERVVVATPRRWDPRVTSGNEQHLYVWAKNGTQLVTVLPNGDLATGLPLPVQGVIPGMEASADARRIVFVDQTEAAARVFVRFNADDPATAVTREVAVGPNDEPCDGARVWDLSADGRQIVFSCNSAILPGGPTTGAYIRDLDGGPGAVRRFGGAAAMVLAATPDYSRVYLSDLDESGALFLMRDGGVPERIVASVSGGTVDGRDISADGEYMAFSSTADFGLPGVDHSTLNGPQVYLYAARTGTLTCVSCRRDGQPTEGPGALRIEDLEINEGGGAAVKSGMRPVSTRGTVTFSSTSALVPEDTNGQADAYAWVDGRAVLLSNGQDQRPSVAQGSSADGSSFFFRTAGALVRDDRDGGASDLYVARVNGGALVPEPAAPPCASNCQGPGSERPSLPGLGSVDLVGRGNLVEDTTEPAQRATASLTVPRSVRGSSTSVRVKVSRAGSIRVSGAGLRPVTVKAKKAGTYRVTMRLSAHGAKQQQSRGRLATRVTARFTPESGASVSARKSVTFTAAKKGGR